MRAVHEGQRLLADDFEASGPAGGGEAGGDGVGGEGDVASSGQQQGRAEGGGGVGELEVPEEGEGEERRVRSDE